VAEIRVVFAALCGGAFVLSFFCWKGYERLARLSGSKSPDPIEDRLDFFTGGRDA
jgi:hypothetical protein